MIQETSIPKEKIHTIHNMLWASGYRQIKILTDLANLGKYYSGIEIHANAIAMDDHVTFIKSLLAGMGFNVTGNTNTETITIK